MGFAMRYTIKTLFLTTLCIRHALGVALPCGSLGLKPDEPGKQLRNFECQACGNSTNELVMFNAPACASKP